MKKSEVMVDKIEKIKRQQDVLRLKLIGMKDWQIAEYKKISIATVWRDFNAVKEEYEEQIKKTDAMGILAVLAMEFDNVLNELWKRYANAEESDKPAILNMVSQTINRKAESFARLGFGKPLMEVNGIKNEDTRITVHWIDPSKYHTEVEKDDKINKLTDSIQTPPETAHVS